MLYWFNFTSMQKKKGAIWYLDRFSDIYNLGFVTAMLIVWTIAFALRVMSEPFHPIMLWDAFNLMYGQFSFKVGCIWLVVFNAFASVNFYVEQYMNTRAALGGLKTAGAFVGNKVKSRRKA